MSRQSLAFGLSTLVACLACLNEVGAKCNDNGNCPTGQFCSGGFCAVGDGGPGDARIDAGVDAGPPPPLAGTVTLNGGLPEPATNTAWVLAWDHMPAVLDSGVEGPDLLVQTDDGGSFAFWDAGLGTGYYLGVVYDIDADGVFDQPGDILELFPNPQTAGAAGCASVALDVQTSACLVWSLYENGMTSIFALIADIPSVTTGNELPSNDVTSATATDPNSQSYGLTEIMGTGIAALDGKYGYNPSIGTAPTAPPGIYRFAIDAVGYQQGTCQVQHQPLSQAPVITVPNPWVSATGNQISWTSVPGADSYAIEVYVVETDGTQGPERYQVANVTSPATIPMGSCPAQSQCRIMVIASDTETQGFRAVSLGWSQASDIVLGT